MERHFTDQATIVAVRVMSRSAFDAHSNGAFFLSKFNSSLAFTNDLGLLINFNVKFVLVNLDIRFSTFNYRFIEA